MKTIVMIPTYNEKENIKDLISLILKNKYIEVLVVDDNSPDRTWEIAEKLSQENKRVHLLLRKTDKGRGSAGRDGFKKCIEMGADIIIEMDADFSHDPRYIPEFLKEIENYDVVLGSRQISGGKDVGRSMARKMITKLANMYIRLILGLKVKDCNSGYRCFRRAVLERINPAKIESNGPSIVQEVLFKAHLKGFRIKEIPIVFKNRTVGNSKLGIRQLLQAYFMVLKLKIKHIKGDI